jgi:anaerobic ribonucleoside-triphosphate reductase
MKRFGEIPGVIDHEHRYLTNSYHVNVRQLIDAFTKIDLESELQLQSMGGAISYVEAPDLTANIDAVEALVDYAYDKLIYFEINLRGLDQCDECGYEGTLIFKDGAWTCPKCGCNNLDKLKIERRTCGYLPSGRGWNAGKTDEINDRVLHLG